MTRINHMSGFWGPVTGSDYCEPNYSETEFIGELANTLTAFAMIFYLGAAYFNLYKIQQNNSMIKLSFVINIVLIIVSTMAHIALKNWLYHVEKIVMVLMLTLWSFLFIIWHRNIHDLPKWCLPAGYLYYVICNIFGGVLP